MTKRLLITQQALNDLAQWFVGMLFLQVVNDGFANRNAYLDLLVCLLGAASWGIAKAAAIAFCHLKIPAVCLVNDPHRTAYCEGDTGGTLAAVQSPPRFPKNTLQSPYCTWRVRLGYLAQIRVLDIAIAEASI
jgi:hypothetical protein